MPFLVPVRSRITRTSDNLNEKYYEYSVFTIPVMNDAFHYGNFSVTIKTSASQNHFLSIKKFMELKGAMAEAALSVSLTLDGISVSYDQELLNEIFHSFFRANKKRFARFKVFRF